MASQKNRVHEKVHQSSAQNIAVPVLYSQDMSLDNWNRMKVKMLVQAKMEHNKVCTFLAPKDLPLKTQTASESRSSEMDSTLR